MKKNLFVTALVLAAVVRPHLVRSEVGFGSEQSMDPLAALSAAKDGAVPAASAVKCEVRKDPRIVPGVPVEWVAIPGGKFLMGNDAMNLDAHPRHEVAVKAFAMSKTAVTVEQYAECVLDGRCTEPGTWGDCNWGKADRARHPINCVDWLQAAEYAKYMDARLPSESEWEYAAKSGGKDRLYPWGNEPATCARAVLNGGKGEGCGTGATMPVCSKPEGNTEQGLCDMAGNVRQWVQDNHRNSYADAPADGSAYDDNGFYRVTRGGSFSSISGETLKADVRSYVGDGFRASGFGFRLAR
ncbi:MAG: SUMF1/EgtB/PvdO family nonheme iron enzyme [Elusimicrobiota bacterium]|jgi:formylglycine-generating enzyme required for sulfatase activity